MTLTGAAKRAPMNRCRDLVEIGIRQYDDGVLAPHFARHSGSASGGLGVQRAADLVRVLEHRRCLIWRQPIEAFAASRATACAQVVDIYGRITTVCR